MIGWGWAVAAFYAGALVMLLVLSLCIAAADGDRRTEPPSGDTGVA